MLKFIAKRLLMMIPVMAGVIVIVFSMMYITPGDPTMIILGETSTEEEREALREDLGLNDGYFKRLGDFCYNLIFKFDLGDSYVTGQPVMNTIKARLPATATMAVVSVAFAVILGMILGIVSAVKPYTLLDNVSMTLALVGVSMPNFWQGLLLMLLFSVKLGWLPATGYGTWKHIILPAITVGTSSAGIIARMTRSSMLEVINADYINTARAKGQKELVVVIRHGLRNALIPVITTAGLQFGSMLGGAVLTETVFAMPGLGKLMVDSVSGRDYTVVQGGVLVIAIMFSLVNLLVDILYAYADPRVRSSYS
ncbi:MAG: ABC transporter permease [Candidatus Avoscillospira sp.]